MGLCVGARVSLGKPLLRFRWLHHDEPGVMGLGRAATFLMSGVCLSVGPQCTLSVKEPFLEALPALLFRRNS